MINKKIFEENRFWNTKNYLVTKSVICNKSSHTSYLYLTMKNKDNIASKKSKDNSRKGVEDQNNKERKSHIHNILCCPIPTPHVDHEQKKKNVRNEQEEKMKRKENLFAV